MLDVDALEAAAAERLTPMAYDYFCGGADEETTLAENVAAWRRSWLRPYVLRDVSRVSTATTVLGAPVRTPVAVAPTAYHLLAHPDGECGTAAAAADVGALFTLSTFATQPLEQVAAAAPDGLRWFQMYVDPDRGFTADLAARAAAAGYTALVLTADVPVLGRRRRDERNAFALPPPLQVAHRPATDDPDDPLPGRGTDMTPTGTPPTDAAEPPQGSALAAHARSHVDPALTFADIGWLADVSGLPVVVKGVLRGDDALACLDAGAAAIWVSNHGGRQLDGAVATADALPEVASAVAGRAEVYVDGGIRTGTDVVRALALGARAVFVGRSVVYGLAAEGRTGVADVLTLLTEELARALALCGVTAPDRVTTDLLAPPTDRHRSADG